MNFTAKSRYALKVMMDLALVAELSPRREVAQRQGIPLDFMDHVIARLRAQGLISSVRGRRGGVALAKDPAAVTLWDIFDAVEDHVLPVRCTSEEGCVHEGSCIAAETWHLVVEEIRQALTRRTLASCLPQERPLAFPAGAEVRECRAARGS